MRAVTTGTIAAVVAAIVVLQVVVPATLDLMLSVALIGASAYAGYRVRG
ncbi:hypothetical protein [Frigidibacter oleivorans]|nr:hypothetical protein [Frigidibacter oleivorans]